MAAVAEHVLDLGWGDSRKRQRRNVIFGEEVYRGGFDAEPRCATREAADEKKFVGVERIGRVVVEVVVVDGR